MRVVDRRDDVRAVLSVEDHASERWISGSHFREARIVVTDCPLRNRRNAQKTKPQTRLLLNAGLKNSTVRRLRVAYAVTKHQPRRRRHSRRACRVDTLAGFALAEARVARGRLEGQGRASAREARRETREDAASRSLLSKSFARGAAAHFDSRCASPRPATRSEAGSRPLRARRPPASRSARGVSSRASRFPASKPLDALARVPPRALRPSAFVSCNDLDRAAFAQKRPPSEPSLTSSRPRPRPPRSRAGRSPPMSSFDMDDVPHASDFLAAGLAPEVAGAEVRAPPAPPPLAGHGTSNKPADGSELGSEGADADENGDDDDTKRYARRRASGDRRARPRALVAAVAPRPVRPAPEPERSRIAPRYFCQWIAS